MAFGQSLHVDLYGVNAQVCDDLSLGYDLLEDLALYLKMHKQSPPFIFRSPEDKFPDKAGLSGWIPLIESGISLHTLTAHEFVTIDIYTCGHLDAPQAVQFLVERLLPTRHESHLLIRGVDFGRQPNPHV